MTSDYVVLQKNRNSYQNILVLIKYRWGRIRLFHDTVMIKVHSLAEILPEFDRTMATLRKTNAEIIWYLPNSGKEIRQ